MIKNLLTAVLLFLSVFVYAQKDIKVVLLNPKQGDSLVNKTPFSVSAQFINVGTEPFLKTDTFYVSYYLNNFKIITGPGLTYTVREILTDTMHVGDTITKNYGNISMDMQRINGYERFCVGVVVYSEAIDQMNNNAGCADMNSFWRTGVNNAISNTPQIQLYPNPFNQVLNLSYNGADQLEIRIMDVTGKLVLNHKNVFNNTEIKTQTLSPGTYFYEVLSSGSSTRLSRGKLSLER
jgi:hypothetical protein